MGKTGVHAIHGAADPAFTNSAADTERHVDVISGAQAVVLERDVVVSPAAVPNLHPLWAFAAGLGVLLLLAVAIQGPLALLKQLFDLAGNAYLVRKSAGRVWQAHRLVSVAIGATVISSTASQAWVYSQESGQAALLMVTKSRDWVNWQSSRECLRH